MMSMVAIPKILIMTAVSMINMKIYDDVKFKYRIDPFVFSPDAYVYYCQRVLQCKKSLSIFPCPGGIAGCH